MAAAPSAQQQQQAAAGAGAPAAAAAAPPPPPGKSPLETILAYKENVEKDLASIEKNIADMEAAYLSAEYSAAGSVLRGFEGHLSTKEALRRRPRGWKPEDRAFSLSSRTSPVTREIEDEQMAADLAAGGNKWRAPAKGKR